MKNSAHILVVDDDQRICNLLERYLCKEGYHVSIVNNGEEMRRHVEQEIPDLVLLDLVLPDEDGLTLARELRDHSRLGIIILTGKGEIMEKIVGLEVGADDYISKPFDKRELLARIHSVLRRLKTDPDKSLGQANGKQTAHFSDWTLDLSAHELLSPAGEEVHLTSYEFKLLSLFVENSNWVLSRDQILDKIADRDWSPDDRSIDVLVVKLRKKLERDALNPVLIKTIRGEGYKFTAQVTFE
ncbi:MAG: response regulator [Gammaproteobacteria bacterium]